MYQNYKWIFCCGAIRSGSTLQYNIAREMVENKNIGISVEYVYPEEFEKVYEKYSNEKGYKIFKTHQLTEFMANLIVNDKALGLYCFRDIRDVALSLIAKNKVNQNDFNYNSFSENYKNHYYYATKLPNIYKSRYEDFYNDIESEAKNIANFLGIKLSDNETISIASQLNIDATKQIIEKSSSQKFKTKNGREVEIDFKTLLHKNHINNIYPGSWKRKLNRRNIIKLESLNYDWLRLNDYPISFYWKLRRIFRFW